MTGKIIRGIGGFYYVHTIAGTVYECRAKGIFRKEKMKPLPGDDVEISIISEEEKTGNVDRILPRRTLLIRPAVANIDQALIIFAAASPEPNLNLLDRFLAVMQKQDIPVLICFNKQDLAPEQCAVLKEIYACFSDSLFFTSIKDGTGIEEIRERLTGRTTVVAGPSGVGKSSMTNALLGREYMETGELSGKLDRGRHTTRHTELVALGKDTFFLDTPGFSSLYLAEMTREDLRDACPEFLPYVGKCRFQGCMHIHEPGCAVKTALEEGKISRVRYDNYLTLMEEIRSGERH